MEVELSDTIESGKGKIYDISGVPVPLKFLESADLESWKDPLRLQHPGRCDPSLFHLDDDGEVGMNTQDTWPGNPPVDKARLKQLVALLRTTRTKRKNIK